MFKHGELLVDRDPWPVCPDANGDFLTRHDSSQLGALLFTDLGRLVRRGDGTDVLRVRLKPEEHKYRFTRVPSSATDAEVGVLYENEFGELFSKLLVARDRFSMRRVCFFPGCCGCCWPK